MTVLSPTSSPLSLLAAVLALVALCGLLPLSVSAAGSTAVELTPAEATVDVSNSTTLDIVVTNADGGVGAYELTLELAGPDAARITEITRLGDPGIGSAEIASDGGSAAVDAGLMDTADTGAVTVARVTIEGEANGTTAVQLSVEALGDEAGANYDVTETRDATLTVGTGSAPTATGTATQSPATEDGVGGEPDTAGTDTVATPNERGAATTDRMAATRTAQSPMTSGRDPGGTTSTPATATERPDPTTGSPTPPASRATEIPGFGALTGIVAIGTLSIIARLRGIQ